MNVVLDMMVMVLHVWTLMNVASRTKSMKPIQQLFKEVLNYVQKTQNVKILLVVIFVLVLLDGKVMVFSVVT